MHTHYVMYPKCDLLQTGLPECGNELWLTYDFAANPQFNGSSIPTVGISKTAASVFAGVVTYEQLDMYIPVRGNTDNVIVPVRVCIAGEVSGVKQKNYTHTIVTVEPAAGGGGSRRPSLGTKHVYPPIRQTRKIPNAVLFVVPSR